MTTTQVLAPRDMVELRAALAQATSATRVLAGGTDLVLALRGPEPEPDLLIDLTRVAELTGVRLVDGRVHVGALTTFGELAMHPIVREHAACLAQAADRIGSLQVRNSATIGGNVANASPCGDSIPVLAALGAVVHIEDSSGGESARALSAVLAGAGRTQLAPNEVITGFSFDALVAPWRSAFAKVGARSVVTVSKLSAAVVVAVVDGAIAEAKVALGSLAPSAFREPTLEALLRGRHADEETARDFAAACVAAVQRAIPTRESLAYKQWAVQGLAYDVWNALELCPPCEPTW